MIVSLTGPARPTNLVNRLIPRPVSTRVPGPGTVALRPAVPFRLLSLGRESVNEFDGLAGGGTKADGGASPVDDAAALLAACMTSPAYAAVIVCAPTPGMKLT